ncbi:S1 family peptidase [Xanthomonas theicola]|uniref:S1 family peptidase n=1 Tax=Xanthomonas theicola TaxID=56464 RepID=UPI001FEA9DA4|nr:S1 family peptidase [Xanthomonas theicola]
MEKEMMMMMRSLLLAVGFATMAPAIAQVQAPVPQDQLEAAAKGYAKDNQVDEKEAGRRLQLKQLARPEIEVFESQYADRLDTSYWDDRRDGFKLILRLKRGPLPAIKQVTTAHGAIPVEFSLVSGKTLDEISAILTAQDGRLRELVPGMQGTGIDEVHSAIVLYVLAPSDDRSAYEAETDSLSRELGAPVTFKFLRGPVESTPPEEAADAPSSGPARSGDAGAAAEPLAPYVQGGPPLLNLENEHQCTGGFIVRNKDNTKWGILTAAHCGKKLMYGNWSDAGSGQQVTAKLTHEAQLFDATHDLAWHSFPVVGYRPLGEIFARDTCAQCGVVILSTAAPKAGDRVCHRGLQTGWSCGVVSGTTYSFGKNDCNGKVCDPRAYKVAVGEELACFGGDSGGPVHYGNTAFGIVKSAAYAGVEPGKCDALVFSPIGKIVDLGLRLY